MNIRGDVGADQGLPVLRVCPSVLTMVCGGLWVAATARSKSSRFSGVPSTTVKFCRAGRELAFRTKAVTLKPEEASVGSDGHQSRVHTSLQRLVKKQPSSFP